MRKPKLFTLVAVVLSAVLIAGCAGSAPEAAEAPASDGGAEATAKTQVVCATFPAYDWTRQIVGDLADSYEITYLMGSGTDLHSYQPTVEDVAKIADADLFVYVGGESDGWAEDAIEAAQSDDLHAISLLEAVGDAAVEEEVVEGMEAEEEEEEEGEEEEGPEYDEHVWLSLKNARVLVSAIAGELEQIDAANASTLAANAEAYNAQLAELDARYADAVAAASSNTVVFGDRFPFRYLVDDYGIKYYAAFVGCSAETEASFETVAFLANKVDELGAKTVFTIEGSDQKIAQTIVDTTATKDQQILVMDSLQSVRDADVAAGKTYLNTMESNLEVLTTALA